MYIKKRRLVVCSIILVIATSILSVGFANPFGFTNYSDFVKFSTVTNMIKNLYYKDVPMSEYVDSAIDGFAQGTGDPYTSYIYGDSAKKYLEDINGSFDGIGIYIENNIEDNTITVVSAISGTPAEAAGLVSGDKILKVAGVSYTGEQINEAVSNMKGQSGTTVDIEVYKAESGEVIQLTVKREHIDVKTVKSKMLDGTNIGYVSISQFIETTGIDFNSAFESLINNGAKSLVIDLRNNPGGYLDSAVQVASNFVKSGDNIVYTLDKAGNQDEYKSKGQQRYISIVVLINQGSASASEIVTGSLKDYGLAHVIGEKSYGKGIVQTVFDAGESIVSVTTSSYYTPNGVSIHGVGIEPDENIPMELNKYARLEKLTLEEDDQLNAAVNYLTNINN